MSGNKALVIGCGLCGSVIARHLAEKGVSVEIWDRRDHIAGNMYDHKDEYGILVQQYGPHIFHTKSKELYDYVCQFGKWTPFKLECGAVWDGKYTPTPFNFTTIDTFYPKEQAESLKAKLQKAYEGQATATVVDVLNNPDEEIRGYAQYLFQNDYAPYTAKQWGVSPSEIDPSVLKRVPLRFSYDVGYFDDAYEVMPAESFTAFFENLLDHPNIQVKLGKEALEHLHVEGDVLRLDGRQVDFPVIYTGALDELFNNEFGRLPYRSLRFEWFHEERSSVQKAPVVAYPQEKGFTRITEYNKLPVQDLPGTTYAKEYPLAYSEENEAEPYYPVLTADSMKQYEKYRSRAAKVQQLHLCGRLADFKYYNMDQALQHALEVCQESETWF